MATPVNRANDREAGGLTLSPADDRLYLRDRELDQGAALIRSAARQLMRLASGGVLHDLENEIIQEIFDRGPMDVGDLKAALDAPRQTLARHLNDLEGRGLITRIVGARDRRRRRVSLTPEGQALAETGAQRRRAAMRRAFLTAGQESVTGARRVLSELARESIDP